MQHPPSFDDGRPPFDHHFAQTLLGKYVLVGVTRQSHTGRIIRKEQFHGRVVEVDAQKGICLRLEGERSGQFEWLPPDTRAFMKASPGEYELSASKEVVIDPDYTSRWTFKATKPAT
jgi:hypothetical protein